MSESFTEFLKPSGFFFTMLPAMRADTWDYNANHKALAEQAGFNFCAQWVWDKQAISLGYCGRPRHELIFMFVKGKVRQRTPTIAQYLMFWHTSEFPGNVKWSMIRTKTTKTYGNKHKNQLH